MTELLKKITTENVQKDFQHIINAYIKNLIIIEYILIVCKSFEN